MGGSKFPSNADGLVRGDQYLYMNGKPVFRWAVRLVADTVVDVLRRAEMGLEDVDLFIPHQANRRIIESAADYLGIPMAKIAINLDRYGNTSAGSIPLALDEAHKSGQIGPQSRLVLCGFGAGLAWGTAVWQW
jgi:3-oxoacyl-[acyl-carrier-protein] synthase-3